MIYNKSGHPIEVKKISVRLWSLRDEIEAAIGRRMKECEAAGVPLYIDDIKIFYNLNLKFPLTDQSNVLQMTNNPEGQREEDAMAALMESIGEEGKNETEAEPAAAGGPEEKAQENKTFSEAEQIIAEQSSQGLETKKPNPILERPYQRQAPDLDKLSYGFSLLSDINMDCILCFTKEKFLQGQSVVVEFLIPQNFIMDAEILYCNHYARTSRIISSNKPDYRVQSKFTFTRPGERSNLRNFLTSVVPTIPTEKKKAAKDTEDDSLGL